MTDWLPVPGWLDLLDIAIVAGFGWLVVRTLRQARARAALAGLALLGVVYLFARLLDLRLAEGLFQGFFAVVVLVLVVVFQEDLRRLFEQLGSWRRGRPSEPAGAQTVDLLVRTIVHLASSRTGALIVLPGSELLDRHVEGGVLISGRLSEPLLLSLFDSSSPGHDGAVILRGAQIERFAVHLPLSSNHAALGPGGTRHAAALGLTERCDATCIVVSEERGTVSVARGGELQVLARPEDLAAELQARFREESEPRPWLSRRAGLDALIATAGALALWMLIVPGAVVTERTVPAGIELTNLAPELELESMEPEQVEVTLRGLRRDLVLAEQDDVSIVVDAYLSRLGRRTFTLETDDVERPEALSVIAITPDRVRVSFRTPEAKPGTGAGPAGAGR